MSQKLFEYLHNELGVTALVDQMDEIKRIVLADSKGSKRKHCECSFVMIMRDKKDRPKCSQCGLLVDETYQMIST